MKRLPLAIILLFCSASAQAQFAHIVGEIERSTGIRRTYIPFLGLARSFIRVIEPQGLSDVRIAVFEGRPRRGTSRVGFDEAVRAAVGPDWQTIVRAVSRRGAERSLIFARPTPRGLRVLIVALERDEAAVVEVELDPRRFMRLVERAHNGDDLFSD